MSTLALQYLMRSLTMKRSKQKQVEERARAGICIIDDCGCDTRSRGLCVKHMNAYYGLLRSKRSEQERLEFEELNIKEGRVLPPGEQRGYRRKSPFMEAG